MKREIQKEYHECQCCGKSYFGNISYNKECDECRHYIKAELQKQREEIIKEIEDFEFKCCDTRTECNDMLVLKECLIQKLKARKEEDE